MHCQKPPCRLSSKAQSNLLRSSCGPGTWGIPLWCKAHVCQLQARSGLRPPGGTQALPHKGNPTIPSANLQGHPPVDRLNIKEIGPSIEQAIQQGLSRAMGALIALSICVTGVPPVEAKLTPEEEATIEVFNTSKPSVVSVTNLALRRDAFTMNMMEFPQGVGSGFVWDEEGHVVTNYHVITDSANVKVTLGTEDLLATVVGVDPDKDVAVLQVLPATISSDPANDKQKRPKSVGSRLDEVLLLPAMSDTDTALVSECALSGAGASHIGGSGGGGGGMGRASMEGPSSAGGWVGGVGGREGALGGTAGPRSVTLAERSSSGGSNSGDDRGLSEAPALTASGGSFHQDQQLPTLKRPPALPDSPPGMVVNMPEAMETMRPLCVASSKHLQVGQRVYAVGNPFGLDHTLTMGIVSGTGREIQSLNGRPINEVIQTDAAINPGNSGGPLLDSSGCVIGITTAIYSSSGQNSGVGFAIPTDTVRTSVEQILKYGKVVRPIVGISFAPDQASEQLGVKGIMVLNAIEGGPAWKAGIQGTSRDEFGRLVLGDIIRAANNEPVRSSSDLYRQLDKSKVGDTIDLEVLRGSSIQHVEVTLEANSTPPSQNVIIIQPKIAPMPMP